MYRQGKFGRHLLDGDGYFFDALQSESREPFDVRVTKIDSLRGIFVSCRLDHGSAVVDAFKRVSKLSEVHDLTSEQRKFVGALYLHQRLYQAIVTVQDDQAVPRELNEKDIPAGKFAVLSVRGPIDKTFAAMLGFANDWLPGSGYRIADISVFEILAADPAIVPYEKIDRDIYIRIEPAQ
jgi:predicted transcriptional regulator YdeE